MSDTVFVTMYAPSLGNVQVDAPLIGVPTYQAHGWLLLDPNATPPPVATPFLTQQAGDSRYVRDWAGAEVLTAGAVRMAPDGHVIVRTADGTTRSSYDATEAALWTVIGGQTAAQLAADPAFRAAYLPRWKASTAYTSGDLVLNPSGQIVQANSSFTSGTSYTASNWTVLTSGGGGGFTAAGDLTGSSTSQTVAKIGGVPIVLSDTRPSSPVTGTVRIGLASTGNTAPGAPTGLTATAGNAQAALSWTAPASNGGAAITDYVVQYRTTAGPGAWQTFADGTSAATTATVTGLTNGTGYDFQVAAVNSVGTGTYSSTASATPSSGADTTAPTAPTSLAAGTPTATTVPLTWTASTDNVGVVAYDVYNSGTLLQSGLTGTSGTVTGLTASTAYVLTLKARDAAGNVSTASNSVNVTTAAGVGTNPTSVTGLSSLWTVDSLSSTDGTEIDSFPSTAGSGTNNTLIQGAGTGPAYRTAVQNGLPVLRGDGTKTMFTSSTMSPALSTTNTVFFVGRFITFANTKTLIDGDTTNSYRLYANSSTQIQMFAKSAGTPGYTLPNPTSWHVFGIRRSGTSANGLQLWVDGTMVAQATASDTTSVTQLRMFGDSTAPANADVGEMVAYNATALSDADMLGVTRFLGNKWGVTTA